MPENYDTTPLIIAAQNGHRAVASALIATGADLNMPKKNGVTPLLIAVQNGYEAVVSALIAAGADFNMPAEDGAMLLLIAARNGHEAVVSALIAAGVNLNIQREDGMTALSLASQEGHGVIVSALLDAGANVSLPNEHNSRRAGSCNAITPGIRHLLTLAAEREFEARGPASEEQLCVVCQEQGERVCMLLLPCRHLCLCETCASDPRLTSCLLCRGCIVHKRQMVT